MKKKNIFILLITFFILGLIFYKINFTQLFHTLKTFNIKYLPVIIGLYVLTLYIRGVRWKALLLNDKKYTALNLAQVFTIGSMLNAFLPARAGDFYRAYYLGCANDENKIKIFGSVILERIFDGIAVFIILLCSVLMFCKKVWILKFTYFTGFLFLGSLVLFYLIYKFDKIDFISQKLINFSKIFPNKFQDNFANLIKKFTEIFKSFINGFSVLSSLRCMAISLITSFIIWLTEGFIAYLILVSFNLHLGISAGLFAICLTSFSTVIPSASVFLGPYQWAYIIALGLFGINKSSALAISAVHQAVFMLILSVIGIYYFLKFNISINDIKKNKEN